MLKSFRRLLLGVLLLSIWGVFFPAFLDFIFTTPGIPANPPSQGIFRLIPTIIGEELGSSTLLNIVFFLFFWAPFGALVIWISEIDDWLFRYVKLIPIWIHILLIFFANYWLSNHVFIYFMNGVEKI